MRSGEILRMGCVVWLLGGMIETASAAGDDPPALRSEVRKEDGYRGIWYSNQPTGDAYRFKYSGGFATYPQQHAPIAIHAAKVEKTFFVYGGRAAEESRLLIMASFLDHRTGEVPRPTVVLDKKTTDAHDNPTLAIDGAGYLWVFSNAHGTSRKAYVHRSREPYSVEGFEPVLETNFSYGQPWYDATKGFLMLHTRYSPGRNLFTMRSKDGTVWEAPVPLARMEMGHYQISNMRDGRVATALNMHPRPIGLNARTNLYYAETRDWGASWETAGGAKLALPLEDVSTPALVRDYRAEGRLVYLKDLQFDTEGRPVVLYLTSAGFEPGPASGPRVWHTARWSGQEWEIRPVTTSDHNYDFGSLWIEPDGSWKVLAPTEPGPQPNMTGGEVVLWVSRDRGERWEKKKQVTSESASNHTYVRRVVNAHPDFVALWADGDPREKSESNLYYTDAEATGVWRLPAKLKGERGRPERVW